MRSVTAAALLCLAALSLRCDADRTQQRRLERDAGIGCGNGELEEGEACDGTNFGNRTCVTEGFESGTLNCSESCELLTASCVRRCGNGVLDSDEQCDGDAGRPSCPNYGYGACTSSCQPDISHCRNNPFKFGAGVVLNQGAGAYLGDLPPAGFGDLVIAVPELGRLETFKFTTAGSLISDRKLSTFKSPLWPIVGQLDGVGGNDIAVIDSDTSVDRFVATATGFSLQAVSRPLDGGSCVARPFVGVGRLDPDALDDLVMYGCRNLGDGGIADDFVIIRGGPTPEREIILSAGSIVTSTLADLDGDGLLDILYVSANAPTELRGYRSAGAAFQALPSRALSFAPSQLAAGDFDEDGDLDLAASDGVTVRIFENTGAAMVERQSRTSTPVFLRAQDLDLDGRADVWFTKSGGLEVLRSAGNFTFTPFTEPFSPDAGVPLAANASDVDGDGDLDIAVSFQTPQGQTSTLLFLNRVRE